MSETVGDRIKEIRDQHDDKQPAFAARLTAAARKLGITANYDNTKVSKMEVGARGVTLQDVAVIASVDKLQRGRSWLAWGEVAVSAALHVTRRSRVVESTEIVKEPPADARAPRRRVAGRKSRDT